MSRSRFDSLRSLTAVANIKNSERIALSVVEGNNNLVSYFVYILQSSSNQLYIGQTNNLSSREKQQINKTSKAAKFIKDGKEFQLVHYETFRTRLEAMRREKQLKEWTRAKKEALIANDLNLLKSL